MKSIYRLRGAMSALVLVFVSAVAFAAGEPATLPQIVVTGTRTAQTQDATLASVTVLTREDIERLQPASLMDLLAGTPGMVISNSGGPGKAGSLFLRGASGSQVLVLVDGVRMGSVSFGSASLPYLPLDQIERIEIVRGPYSSLYGADAVAGVVQIFLRHDPGSFAPNASIGVGSYATRNVAAGFASNGERGWISVQGSHQRTDGINACRIGAAQAFAGCFIDQPDLDGFSDNALTVNGSYRFNSQWSADALAFRSQGSNEYDVSVSDGDDYSIQTVGGQLHYQPAARVKLSMRAGSSTDFATGTLAGVAVSHFNSRRNVASAQADLGVGDGLLSMGYDWERQSLASATTYAVTNRVVRGLFTQWQTSLGANSLQANLRRDDNEGFGGQTTGSLLWGHDLGERLRVTANVGSAFRAPTFNDLYYPGYGNAGLRPEHSRTLQVGLRGTPGWGRWSLEAYRNDVRDLIEFDASTYSPGNVGRVRISGIEGVLEGSFAGWTLRSTASVLRTRNQTPGSIHAGKQMPRRAERSAHFDADRSFGRFSAGASWQVVGQRFDDLGNQHPLGGYALLDLRTGWNVTGDWRLDLALRNVFDKSYETAWYFNQPGRNAMLTIAYRPAP